MNKKYDALGKRMKDYEMRTRSYLPRRSNIVIRIDGKAFHTYTRGLDKPFDNDLMEDMAKVTKYLCENIQGAKFGYTQSDEISILFTDYDDIKTNAWFDGQVQKIVSVASSLAASKFNQLRIIRELNNMSDFRKDDIISMIENKRLGDFDARVYTLPEPEEVVNYFIWRQNDATRNSISMLAQSEFSQNQLNKVNTNQMQDLLFEQKGINWNDCKIIEKRGTGILRKNTTWVAPIDNKSFKPNQILDNMLYDPDTMKLFNRSLWSIDTEIPILTQDRDYILNLLPKR